MDSTAAFEAERSRLVALAGRILADHAEAEDVVQQAWLRLERADGSVIDSLPAWLTTVTTRLYLDRLRSGTPTPTDQVEPTGVAPDPAEDVVATAEVGAALRVVLDRLTPTERVALVVFDFTIEAGRVREIRFRAAPEVLSTVVRRDGHIRRTPLVKGMSVDTTPRRPRRREPVKTMTCRQLGGPCELAHHGESADDVINAQDRHLKEAERTDDASHQPARDAMKGRWRHPKRSMSWYRENQQAFADLLED